MVALESEAGIAAVEPRERHPLCLLDMGFPPLLSYHGRVFQFQGQDNAASGDYLQSPI